ncbi:MAG: hypothetical protein ACRD2Y_11800 [Terriglobales bacterium]
MQLLVLSAIQLLVLVIALVFVVPLFANLFVGLGVDLPISSKWLGILPAWLLVVLAILIPLFLFATVIFVLWKVVRRLASQ